MTIRTNNPDDVHTLKDLAENDVAAIEPASGDGGDKLQMLIRTAHTVCYPGVLTNWEPLVS
jgi:hypothetical protein